MGLSPKANEEEGEDKRRRGQRRPKGTISKADVLWERVNGWEVNHMQQEKKQGRSTVGDKRGKTQGGRA